MNEEQPDESVLLDSARNNDLRAFERLYRLHVGRVFALCLRLLGDRDQAEDVTQDAFVKAWKNLSRFRGDSAFGTWLYRIASNCALSELRKQKGFHTSLEDEDLALPYRESQAEQIGLESAIAQLPDGARAVFVLYSVEGYTHQEIAGMLGIAAGSSKAQLHRARTLLKQVLA